MCYGATVFEGKANNTLEFPYQIHWKCAEFDRPLSIYLLPYIKGCIDPQSTL